MSQPSPPPPPSKGFISEIISSVLAYVDKPWKVVAVVVLVVVGGLGWTLYEKRNELIESWLTPSKVELKVDDVPDALLKLVEETGADLVQIWAVDLPANSQRFLGARRKDGQRPIIPEPRRLPAIVATSDIKALTNVLAGYPACIGAKEGEAPLMRRLADRGINHVCGVPIPPSSEALVGIIYVAWDSVPDANAEAGALVAAREISATLVNW